MILEHALEEHYPTGTMCLQDPISNRINEGVIEKLILEFPGQINRGAFIGWEKRLSQDVGLIGEMALVNLIAQNGEVDIVGAGWECQSISRGARKEGYVDRRFQYFYDLVRILGWLQHHHERSPVYFLENTYPGELAKMP